MAVKNFLGVFVLLIVFQVGIVLAQGEILDLTHGLILDNAPKDFSVAGKGVEINLLVFNKIDITGTGLSDSESAYLKIGENEFNNLNHKAGGFIKLDNFGEILESEFETNRNGGAYTINNVIFEAPPYSKVHYNKETGFQLPKQSKIKNIEELSKLEEHVMFKGEEIIFSNGLVVFDGKTGIDKKGYKIFSSKNFNYKGMDIVETSGDSILIANPDLDLSEYLGSWIKINKEFIEIKSSEIAQMHLNFLKENQFLKIDDTDSLSFDVWGGDSLKIDKSNNIFHQFSEGGTTKIQDGPYTLKYHKGNLIYEFPEMEGMPYSNVKMNLYSNSEELKDLVFSIEEDDPLNPTDFGEVVITDRFYKGGPVGNIKINEDYSKRIEYFDYLDLKRISRENADVVLRDILPLAKEHKITTRETIDLINTLNKVASKEEQINLAGLRSLIEDGKDVKYIKEMVNVFGGGKHLSYVDPAMRGLIDSYKFTQKESLEIVSYFSPKIPKEISRCVFGSFFKEDGLRLRERYPSLSSEKFISLLDDYLKDGGRMNNMALDPSHCDDSWGTIEYYVKNHID